MENVLITGATGFLGQELIKRMDFNKQNVRVLSRNEGKLLDLKNRYPLIEVMTGSIEDEYITRKAMHGIDAVYHLAAFKHVGLAEVHTYQCTISNIYGTINLLKYFAGNLFVSISTDKVARVSGVYGASKLIIERLLHEQSLIDKAAKYVIPRYGNVLGSTGSILPKWIDAAKHNKPISITNPQATRFFFTVADAVDLIFEAIAKGESGVPYIKHMKSCYIGDLAEAIQLKYGEFERIDTIGMQPGENTHEYLDRYYCSSGADKFTLDELTAMI